MKNQSIENKLNRNYDHQLMPSQIRVFHSGIQFMIITLAILFTVACTKPLELTPAQVLTNETALSTDASVKQVLVGAYDEMALDGLFGGEVLRNSELFAGEGEVVWVGTFEAPREIFNRDILVANGDVEAFWAEAYNCINICNNILSALDVVNEEDRARVEGEAKCLRGWMLFEMTRYFAQSYEPGQNNTQPGVPIVLNPTIVIDESSTPARSTVEECYAQVITDLTEAESLLPESNDVFVDQMVAASLLARVYLQQSNFENARDAADRVIASGNYSLMPAYKDAFNQVENTKEDIFAIQISEQDGENAMNEYFATASNGGRRDILIEDAHIALYPSGDLREDMFYTSQGDYLSGKWKNQYANIPIIRLAEIYLIRAECNQRLGTATGAAPLDDYNKVHTRAALPAATAVTLDDILMERRLELAHEGFKYHDVKRLKGIVGTMPYNDNKLIYPIPQRELEVNKNLVQNPGY
ncbi:MAG: RagB/SusD family nutrient uptake outer membrane protein [Chitinophagaceae bacterium]|nr:RagB/SusD family nutrient uptake outer membrane protein [Chitinophagaceae bacterium]